MSLQDALTFQITSRQPCTLEPIDLLPANVTFPPCSWQREKTNLVVPSMLVQERDDGFDVVLLDDVQNLRALNQHTVQHLKNT